MNAVKLKKTVVVSVQSAKIVTLNAVLDDNSTVEVSGPVSAGDFVVVDDAGKSSVLAAADYAAELVA